MILAYVTVFLIGKLTLFGVVSSLVSEFSFTLLLGVTAFRLCVLANKSQNLPWQRGIKAMALAAAVITLHNLAWVYGSVVGEVPLPLEFLGATLYTLQVIPWAYALSVALFIVYDRMRGALYLEVLTYVVGLIAAVVFLVAVILGLIFSLEMGVTIADSAGLYLSAALLVPALAFWFSGDASLTRPFLFISAATGAWFLADLSYVTLPESSADLVFNCFALIQWFLFYRAARTYVAKHRLRKEVTSEHSGRWALERS